LKHYDRILVIVSDLSKPYCTLITSGSVQGPNIKATN